MRQSTLFILSAVVAMFVILITALFLGVNGERDTLAAWLGGTGGILGAFASLYAISIAVRADTEHVTWVESVTETSLKGKPKKYKITNSSKVTVAEVLSFEDLTGDSNSAIDLYASFPLALPPGASFPVGISRSLAHSSPTLARVTWREKRVDQKRFRSSELTQTVFLL